MAQDELGHIGKLMLSRAVSGESAASAGSASVVHSSAAHSGEAGTTPGAQHLGSLFGGADSNAGSLAQRQTTHNQKPGVSSYVQGLRAVLAGASTPSTGTVAGITTPFELPPASTGAGAAAATTLRASPNDYKLLEEVLISVSNCVSFAGLRLGATIAAAEAQDLANSLAVPFMQELPSAQDFYDREQGVCIKDSKIFHRLAPGVDLSCVVYSIDFASLTGDVVSSVLGGFPWSPPEEASSLRSSVESFVGQIKQGHAAQSQLLPWDDWKLWHLAEVPFAQLVAPVHCTSAQRDSWGELEMENLQQDGMDMLQSAFDEALKELFQRCVHQLRIDLKRAATEVLQAAALSLSKISAHTEIPYNASKDKSPFVCFGAVSRMVAPSVAWEHLRAAAGAGASNPGGAFSAAGADTVFDLKHATVEVRTELSGVSEGLAAWPKLRRPVLGVAGVLTGMTGRGGAARSCFRENLRGSIFTCMAAFYDFVDIVFSMGAGGADEHTASSAVHSPAPPAAAKTKAVEAAAHDAPTSAAAGGAAASASQPASFDSQQARGVFSEAHVRALECVPGKAAISSDTPVTAAALPVHAYALPQPSNVKAALGLATGVKGASMSLSRMPRPMHGASLFTHRGKVYLLSGNAQHLPSESLNTPISSVSTLGGGGRGMSSVRDALDFMGITHIPHLLDANLVPIDTKQLIAPHLGRLAAATLDVRKCLESVWNILNGEHPRWPNSKAEGFIRYVQQLQASADISPTTSTRLYPGDALYRLELSGSNYKYQSLLMDERVPEAKRAALQHLARQALGHGQAAEWVKVPSIQYGCVAWSHTLAVPLSDKNDPRVVLIGGLARGKWNVCTMTITAQGAGLDKPSWMFDSVPAAPGATAVKLVGEPTIVLYGGQDLQRKNSGVTFISVNQQGLQTWAPGVDEVCGEVPDPPLSYHGACMLRNGNMVVAGGTFRGGNANTDVYVATILGCRAITGSPLARAASTDGRVLWSKVARAKGAAGMGQPRSRMSMHKLPGGDSFVIFGGQLRSGDSATHPMVCTIRSRSEGVDKQALLRALGGSRTADVRFHGKDPPPPLVAFEAKWSPLRVGDAAQSRPGEEPVPWESPRHEAASTMLNGRLLVFGGLVQEKSCTIGTPAVTSFPFEKDFSAVLKSRMYSGTAVRTKGGAGVHAWGVPAIVETFKGGMRSDVQVVKLVADSIRLAASSLAVDLHWLWAGVHRAHVSCVAEQWSIAAAGLPAAQTDAGLMDLQEATGADDARLSSAAVADVVLQCAPPLQEDWPAERTALAAHRCIVGATIPLLNMQLRALEATVDTTPWELHEGAAEDGEGTALPSAPSSLLSFQFGGAAADQQGLDLSSPPQLTLQRSVSVGADKARPALAQPSCSAQQPLVLSLPFVPVDAMAIIIRYVYTGSVEVPGPLLPAVWAACQVLGLAGTAKAVIKAARTHRAAEKSERGVTSKTVFEPRSKKWRHNVLFTHGRKALSDPEWSSDPTDFAECPLPLVAVDSKLAAACEEYLRIDRQADGATSLSCASAVVSVGGPHRSVNRSTVAGLRWLHTEKAFGDMLLEIQLPAADDDEEGSGIMMEPDPQAAYLRAHAAVMAARSKLWRGSLCSEHFQRDGHVASLGAHEGVQLSIEDATSVLDFVYSDSAKSIGVDATPLVLPLASQHSMARLSSYCERTMVHSFDLDDLASAVGMWFYGSSLGTAGARLARIAMAAVRDAAVSRPVLQSVLDQFLEAGEVEEQDAQAFLQSL